MSCRSYATSFGRPAHGPRSGDPAAASWAEGRLLIRGSYSTPADELTAPPFRDAPEEILVRIEILDDEQVVMRVQASPVQPQTTVTIDEVVHGVLRGSGTIVNIYSPLLIDLREPQLID